MAEKARKPTCPLCGQALREGDDGLEALGRHFERCPKTDRVGKGPGPMR